MYKGLTDWYIRSCDRAEWTNQEAFA